MARVIATDCRSPPESVHTGSSAERTRVRPSSEIAASAALRICRRRRTRKGPMVRTISLPRKKFRHRLNCSTMAKSWYTASMPMARASAGVLKATSLPMKRRVPEVGRW